MTIFIKTLKNNLLLLYSINKKNDYIINYSNQCYLIIFSWKCNNFYSPIISIILKNWINIPGAINLMSVLSKMIVHRFVYGIAFENQLRNHDHELH